MSQIQENLLYTEDHEWVKIENDIVTIGISDFAQSSLGDIVFVELPEEGTKLESGASFGVVESIKSVSDLYTPVTGSITEKNTTVEETPESLNSYPYDSWLVKIKLQDESQTKNLMNAEQYKSFCSE